MDEFQLRPLALKDKVQITRFLKAQNMSVSLITLERLLTNNPGLSQGVFQGEALVGTILCSWDGVKGYLNKLVVAEEQRQNGWGQKLVTAAVDALKETGCSEVVINCHPYLAKWYEKQGFVKQDLVCYTLRLEGETQEVCG